MKTTASLTEGHIFKNLLVFAIPFLIANFMQALYGAVDTAVVGWFSDSAGISAVSTGSQVMQIVNSLVSGLTMGGTILIAQYFGAKQEQDNIETISTMLTLFAISAVGFSIIMWIACPWILQALQTPAEAYEQAYQYVMIASGGILFIFGYNAISAILRGLGDSKSPLIFIGIACVSNIILDLLFVGPAGMGAAGASLATVISQAISVIIAVIYLKKRSFLFEFKLKNFHIYKHKALMLIKIGLPVSLQETMTNLSFLFIAAIVNSLGVVASAAVGIAGKFDAFAMLPASAFSGAIAAIAGQNIGAGKPERAKKSLNASMLLSVICGMIFFLWAQIFPESIMQIFKADMEVTASGVEYLRGFSFDFIMVSFIFCMNGFFNGCGKTTFSMANGLISTLLVRVPLAYIFSVSLSSSLFGVGLAAPLASLLSIILAVIYLQTGRWKKAVIT